MSCHWRKVRCYEQPIGEGDVTSRGFTVSLESRMAHMASFVRPELVSLANVPHGASTACGRS